MDGPYDPRSIANLMLDEGHRRATNITNLALQKLLYFAHALYLVERKRPLVSGNFEAWTYGPVHPTVYEAFKTAGDRPITTRAAGIDIMTGRRVELPTPADPDVRRHIERVMLSYGSLTPGRLVDISHAKDAPWDFVVNKGRTSVAFGLRISDNVILERFKFHKVSVHDVPAAGEPGEDAPLA
jgi:uncharacterized phage-associated protein